MIALNLKGGDMNTLTMWYRCYGADLVALLVVTIWGGSFVIRKVALDQFDVHAFNALRFLGMLVLAWGVLLWRRRAAQVWIGVKRSDLPSLALAGVLGYTLYITLSTIGLHYTTAFSSTLLLATSPLFAALLLWICRLEPIGLRQWLGMLIALLGVFVFLLEKAGPRLGAAITGDLISLIAALFFAGYNVANKPLLTSYPAIVVTTYSLTIGGIPVILLSLPAMFAQDWNRVSLTGWTALGWSIVVPVYVAWTLWSWASARTGVARISMFMYLVPIVSGIASWLLLAEGFGLLKLAGAFVILSGLVLTRRAGAANAVEHGRAEVEQPKQPVRA